MYVNPILIGVVGTLLVEFFILTIACGMAALKKGEENGKDNNNQSNQQNQHKDS